MGWEYDAYSVDRFPEGSVIPGAAFTRIRLPAMKSQSFAKPTTRTNASQLTCAGATGRFHVMSTGMVGPRRFTVSARSSAAPSTPSDTETDTGSQGKCTDARNASISAVTTGCTTSGISGGSMVGPGSATRQHSFNPE